MARYGHQVWVQQPSQVEEFHVWWLLWDSIHDDSADFVAVGVSFPVNVILANSVYVEGATKSRNLGVDLNVPDNSNSLIKIIVVNLIVD